MFVPRLVRLALVIGLVCSAFAVGVGAAQAAAPANDDFDHALVVNEDSSGRTVNTDLSEATVETSEPFTGVASTFTRTTWFSYDAPDDGTGVVDLCASTVDVSARVYTDAGTGFAGLDSIGSVVACGQGAKVTFSFSAGDTLAFQIGVTGTGDTTGSVIGAVHVWPVPLNDLRGQAQTLADLGSVGGWTTHATSTVTVPADVTDDPTLGSGPSAHTVWYDWTAPATFAYGFTLCRENAADLGPYDMATSMLAVQHWGGSAWDIVGRGSAGGCAGQPGLDRAVVQAEAGESYQIMVGSSPAGQPGDFELAVVPAPEDEGADPFDPVGPTISGNPAPGGALSSDEGGLTGADTFRYEWLACTPGTTTCAAPYGNPSGKTYVVPTCPGGGYAMRVRVTGSNWVGSATTALSDEVLVPAHACPAPTFTGPGALSGVAKVRKATHDLTFTAGRWSVACAWPVPCTGAARLKARLGGHWVVLGSASFSAPAGSTPGFAVHLGKKALKKLRTVRSAKGRLYLTVSGPDQQTSTLRVRLKVSHGKA
jgi:hypothetical protein